MNKLKCTIFLAFCLCGAHASADVYSDDLAKCLVESSTQADKDTLVRWMFTSLALHPAVSRMAAVSDADRDAANKDAARMFVRLLTETCVVPARKAVQYEGPAAIGTGFTVFGRVAGRELFANPNVAQALTGLKSHIDGKKLQETLNLPSR